MYKNKMYIPNIIMDGGTIKKPLPIYMCCSITIFDGMLSTIVGYRRFRSTKHIK